MGVSIDVTPIAGSIVSVMLSLIGTSVLVVFLNKRLPLLKKWRTLTLTHWFTLALYLDSICLLVGAAVLNNAFGLNKLLSVCSAAIIICIICYFTTKVLLYCFLVEKAYIVRATRARRLKSKFYVFHCFGMLVVYILIAVTNFVWRFARFNNQHVCIIGMERKVLLPAAIFDLAVNVYMTAWFIIPLRAMYSYKNNPNSVLRTTAFRAFFGALATIGSSMINIIIMVVLNGEPGWVCMISCSADVLFTAIAVHWVTGKDSSENTRSIAVQVGERPSIITCNHCNPSRKTAIVDPVLRLNDVILSHSKDSIKTDVSCGSLDETLGRVGSSNSNEQEDAGDVVQVTTAIKCKEELYSV